MFPRLGVPSWTKTCPWGLKWLPRGFPSVYFQQISCSTLTPFCSFLLILTHSCSSSTPSPQLLPNSFPFLAFLRCSLLREALPACHSAPQSGLCPSSYEPYSPLDLPHYTPFTLFSHHLLNSLFLQHKVGTLCILLSVTSPRALSPVTSVPVQVSCQGLYGHCVFFFFLSFCYFLGRSPGIWRFPG